MALPFGPYEGQDLTEYEAGNKFLPREFYSLNYTPSTALASTVGNTGGVTGTQAASPYIWPPQGGGGGGGGGTGNKFGLNLDTQKTIQQGKWVGNEYVKTPRNIAKTEGGMWKDIDTGQNVYHGNINIKTPMTMIMDKLTGKKTTDDPYADSWYGSDWDEEEMNIGKRRTVPQNIIQRWMEKRDIKKQEKAAKDAKIAEEKEVIQAQEKEGDGYQKGSWGGHGSVEAYDESQKATYDRAVDRHRGAQGGRIGYQEGELVEDEYMAEATPFGMMEENIEGVQGEPTREQLEIIAFEIFQLPLEQLSKPQLEIVYRAAMEQEPAEEEVQFAAQEGPTQGIASLV